MTAIRRFAALVSLLSFLLYAVAPAKAGVSLKNGNFFIGYTDLVGLGLDIKRTYNSQSSFDGLFGYGWGWYYETRLYALPDGSVAVVEHGGGDLTWFEPAFFNPDLLDETVNRIVELRIRDGALRSPSSIAAFRTELREDDGVRLRWWRDYLASGDLEPYDPPEGSAWAGGDKGFAQVVRTAEGYRRTKGGTTEEFDAEGRLVRIEDGDGVRTLGYDADGRLAWIESEMGTRVEFTLDEDERIVRAEMTTLGGDAHAATYEYDERGDLVDTRDADGFHYRYEYDDFHNMTAILYVDGTAMRISYDSSPQGSNYVTRVKDRDGSVTRYEYEKVQRPDGSVDESRFTTRVILQGDDGEEIVNTYTYEERVTESGRRYTYRIDKTKYGRRTVTTFNECCGQPLSIRVGDQETTFAYDARGNLTRMANADEVILSTYDLNVNKPIRIERWTPDQSTLVEWFAYSYDESGQPTRAERSNGDWAEVTYDENDRSLQLKGHSESVTLEYGRWGKPSRLALGTGEGITYRYNANGGLEDRKPTGGATSVLEVIERFWVLQDVFRFAGVDFGL